MQPRFSPSQVRNDVSGAPAPWVVYIVECRDGSYYTGISNDIARRLEEHNAGTASRYTRSRRPVVLRYQETVGERSEALMRECAVKLLTRKEKIELIRRHGGVSDPPTRADRSRAASRPGPRR
jgi:putative endonuclease